MNCPSTDMKSCVSDAQTHVQACKEREEGVNKRKKEENPTTMGCFHAQETS